MENENQTPKKPKNKNSKIVLNNRQNLTITGIDRVYSANDTLLSLEVSGDNLVVDGSNMQVVKLDIDAGIMEIKGLINIIKYANGKKSARHLLGRIFK